MELEDRSSVKLEYHVLPRRQLQTLCKKHGIPANGTNASMADALTSIQQNTQNTKQEVDGDVVESVNERSSAAAACVLTGKEADIVLQELPVDGEGKFSRKAKGRASSRRGSENRDVQLQQKPRTPIKQKKDKADEEEMPIPPSVNSPSQTKAEMICVEADEKTCERKTRSTRGGSRKNLHLEGSQQDKAGVGEPEKETCERNVRGKASGKLDSSPKADNKAETPLVKEYDDPKVLEAFQVKVQTQKCQKKVKGSSRADAKNNVVLAVAENSNDSLELEEKNGRSLRSRRGTRSACKAKAEVPVANDKTDEKLESTKVNIDAEAPPMERNAEAESFSTNQTPQKISEGMEIESGNQKCEKQFKPRGEKEHTTFIIPSSQPAPTDEKRIDDEEVPQGIGLSEIDGLLKQKSERKSRGRSGKGVNRSESAARTVCVVGKTPLRIVESTKEESESKTCQRELRGNSYKKSDGEEKTRAKVESASGKLELETGTVMVKEAEFSAVLQQEGVIETADSLPLHGIESRKKKSQRRLRGRACNRRDSEVKEKVKADARADGDPEAEAYAEADADADGEAETEAEAEAEGIYLIKIPQNDGKLATAADKIVSAGESVTLQKSLEAGQLKARKKRQGKNSREKACRQPAGKVEADAEAPEGLQSVQMKDTAEENVATQWAALHEEGAHSLPPAHSVQSEKKKSERPLRRICNSGDSEAKAEAETAGIGLVESPQNDEKFVTAAPKVNSAEECAALQKSMEAGQLEPMKKIRGKNSRKKAWLQPPAMVEGAMIGNIVNIDHVQTNEEKGERRKERATKLGNIAKEEDFQSVKTKKHTTAFTEGKKVRIEDAICSNIVTADASENHTGLDSPTESSKNILCQDAEGCSPVSMPQTSKSRMISAAHSTAAKVQLKKTLRKNHYSVDNEFNNSEAETNLSEESKAIANNVKNNLSTLKESSILELKCLSTEAIDNSSPVSGESSIDKKKAQLKLSQEEGRKCAKSISVNKKAAHIGSIERGGDSPENTPRRQMRNSYGGRDSVLGVNEYADSPTEKGENSAQYISQEDECREERSKVALESNQIAKQGDWEPKLDEEAHNMNLQVAGSAFDCLMDNSAQVEKQQQVSSIHQVHLLENIDDDVVVVFDECIKPMHYTLASEPKPMQISGEICSSGEAKLENVSETHAMCSSCISVENSESYLTLDNAEVQSETLLPACELQTTGAQKMEASPFGGASKIACIPLKEFKTDSEMQLIMEGQIPTVEPSPTFFPLSSPQSEEEEHMLEQKYDIESEENELVALSMQASDSVDVHVTSESRAQTDSDHIELEESNLEIKDNTEDTSFVSFQAVHEELNETVQPPETSLTTWVQSKELEQDNEDIFLPKFSQVDVPSDDHLECNDEASVAAPAKRMPTESFQSSDLVVSKLHAMSFMGDPKLEEITKTDTKLLQATVDSTFCSNAETLTHMNAFHNSFQPTILKDGHNCEGDASMSEIEETLKNCDASIIDNTVSVNISNAESSDWEALKNKPFLNEHLKTSVDCILATVGSIMAVPDTSNRSIQLKRLALEKAENSIDAVVQTLAIAGTGRASSLPDASADAIQFKGAPYGTEEVADRKLNSAINVEIQKNNVFAEMTPVDDVEYGNEITPDIVNHEISCQFEKDDALHSCYKVDQLTSAQENSFRWELDPEKKMLCRVPVREKQLLEEICEGDEVKQDDAAYKNDLSLDLDSGEDDEFSVIVSSDDYDKTSKLLINCSTLAAAEMLLYEDNTPLASQSHHIPGAESNVLKECQKQLQNSLDQSNCSQLPFSCRKDSNPSEDVKIFFSSVLHQDKASMPKPTNTLNSTCPLEPTSTSTQNELNPGHMNSVNFHGKENIVNDLDLTKLSLRKLKALYKEKTQKPRFDDGRKIVEKEEHRAPLTPVPANIKGVDQCHLFDIYKN